MSILLIMLPAALLLAGLGVWAFIRAARAGQFDDLDTPPLRAVFDDEPADHSQESHRPPV
jgi:cbb3-type cytochrome oxidase maturation protein